MRRSWKSLAFRAVVLVWALAVRVTSGRLPDGVTVGDDSPARVRLLPLPRFALWQSVWVRKCPMWRRPERQPKRESVN